jgi:hypothetical protein
MRGHETVFGELSDHLRSPMQGIDNNDADRNWQLLVGQNAILMMVARRRSGHGHTQCAGRACRKPRTDRRRDDRRPRRALARNGRTRTSPLLFGGPAVTGRKQSRERRIVASVSALEIDRDFPTSLTAGRRCRARGGCRRTSGALLVPMLLNGECGYEDLRLFSPVAVDSRL